VTTRLMGCVGLLSADLEPGGSSAKTEGKVTGLTSPEWWSLLQCHVTVRNRRRHFS